MALRFGTKKIAEQWAAKLFELNLNKSNEGAFIATITVAEVDPRYL